MTRENFVKQNDVIYKTNTVSYVQEDNEDNWFEVSEIYNDPDTQLIVFYNRCEAVRYLTFNRDFNAPFATAEDYAAQYIEEIYG